VVGAEGYTLCDVAERTFNLLKQGQALAIRFGKLAVVIGPPCSSPSHVVRDTALRDL
jgi:hypothetical protein